MIYTRKWRVILSHCGKVGGGGVEVVIGPWGGGPKYKGLYVLLLALHLKNNL